MTNDQRMQQALDRILQERSAFLSQLEGLSQGQVDFKPSASSWSAGEVAQHVGLTEKMFQDNIRELVRSGQESRGATRKSSFKELPMAPWFLPKSLLQFDLIRLPFSIMASLTPRVLQSFVLANPFFQIKTAPSLEPKAGMPLAQLRKYLSELRDATLKLLEPVRSWNLSRLRWEHPLMGTHDVYEMLELLANHDQRHRMQVQRIKANKDFPAS